MATAAANCPAEPLDSETPLFILYTSGSTGKPKGIMHTTAGYNLFAKKTMEWVFDIRDEDVYWCTADIGWITGHTYVVYGPLTAGATIFMYEGAPDTPHQGRWWEMIEKYKINILYTAPTAIRTFIKWGDPWVDKYDLSSLRLLGTVGEGINPEAWMWYHRKIGGRALPDRRHLVADGDGRDHDDPAAGGDSHQARQLHQTPARHHAGDRGHGPPAGAGRLGRLADDRPALAGHAPRHLGRRRALQESVLDQVPHRYLCGDNARCDEDGYYWIMGRIDDVLNVAGHRLSTIEIESALVSHEAVAEAAAVGRPHDVKGEAVTVFVTLTGGFDPSEQLRRELMNHVRNEIGALAVPDEIHFTTALPKTRSGKIMRRLLRNIAAGRQTVGDTSTLEDFSVLARLRTEEE